MGKENQVTREGFEKLKKELEELKGPTRMYIADQIREAKSHGDLRENSAYHECKLNQSRLESRISDLEKALQLARIVERPRRWGMTANLGSRVVLLARLGKFDDEFSVSPRRAHSKLIPQKDLISIASPLGESMLGKVVGDERSRSRPRLVTVAIASSEWRKFMKRLVVFSLAIFALIGCQSGESTSPEATSTPEVVQIIVPVGKPSNPEATKIALVVQKDTPVTVGYSADAAFRAFRDPKEYGNEYNDLPPNFQVPYRARSWEAGQAGFGEITYDGNLVAAMYREDKVLQDRRR